MRTWPALAIACLMIAGAPIHAQQIDRRNPLVDAIAKTKNSIVNLRTSRVIPARLDEADSGGRVKGLGTGVIIDPRGYVVTNYHVVEQVDEIRALTSEGDEYSVKEIGYDKNKDVAVLKIQSRKTFEYLPLWGAGKAILGETVFAIGNPFGLETTVTSGIVSSVDRELKLPNNEFFKGLIQTDAGINPGNSGGPLLTVNGELLGINVAIRKDAQRIGFALPTDEVRKIVEKIMGEPSNSIMRQGLVINGFFEESNLSRISAKERLSPKVGSVEPGSPAQKVGFQPGDEVMTVAGQQVRTRFDLERVFWDRSPGEKLNVTVRRNGKEEKVLEFALPGRKQTKNMTDAEVVWEFFGVQVSKVPASKVRGVHASLNGGLHIDRVAVDSPADRAGFRQGDILVGLSDYEMVDWNNIRFVMQWDQLSQNQPIKYHVIRNGTLESGTLQMPSIPKMVN